MGVQWSDETLHPDLTRQYTELRRTFWICQSFVWQKNPADMAKAQLCRSNSEESEAPIPKSKSDFKYLH